MNEANTANAQAVVLRRTFKAPRWKVFDAWTKPEQLREWFGPAGTSAPEVAVDLREGGKFRIAIVDSDGDRNVAAGTFTKVRRPEGLAFTWCWETNDPPDIYDTQITIDFVERGDETEMVFKHEGFRKVESRNGHESGWTTSFDKLAAFIASAR
jgi:uncharacterized protein YndB with AHSA1/START domain